MSSNYPVGYRQKIAGLEAQNRALLVGRDYLKEYLDTELASIAPESVANDLWADGYEAALKAVQDEARFGWDI